MKKIVVAMAIAFAAVVVNAASVDWNVAFAGGAAGRVMDANGKVWTSATAGNSNQTAYFMLTSQVDAFVAALGAGTSLDGLYLDSTTAFNTNTGVMSAPRAASSDKITTAAQDFTTILVYTTGTGEDIKTYYMESGVASSNPRLDASDPASVTFASNTAFAGQQFEQVPEPTSGLLLLVGAAALALRRRRA